jgi:hypothetical protein
LPDVIFKARENLIFDRIMALPLEERLRWRIDCVLVRYDGDDSHYRAHAFDCDGNEVHVTGLGPFSGAQRMLREWAVANEKCYSGGYTRYDNPELFSQLLRERSAP